MSETDDRAPVTAPTPEQMRALAEEHQTQRNRSGTERYGNPAEQLDRHDRTYVTLRAAAAQLEAVRALSVDLDKERGQHEVFALLVASDIRDILDGHPERVVWTEKPAFLTADTAPQEGRHE